MKFVYLGILSGGVCLWTCCDAGGGSCCDGGLSGATGCVQATEYGSGSNQNELQALEIKGDHLPQEQTYLRLFGDLLLLEGNKAAVEFIYKINIRQNSPHKLKDQQSTNRLGERLRLYRGDGERRGLSLSR